MKDLFYLLICGLWFTSCGKESLNQKPVDSTITCPSESDWQVLISDVYTKHAKLVTFINELDAAYLGVNDKVEYLSVKEKTYVAGDPLTWRLWCDAYEISSGYINSILEIIYANPHLTKNSKERNIGQLLAVRGHIYLQLTLWFGKAPLVLKKWEGESLPERNRNEILNAVIADFEAALLYYVDSEYTYMKREQILQYLIQAYALKGESPKVVSLLKNVNVSENTFYIAIKEWLSGKNAGVVMDLYKSGYSKDKCYAGKLLLNIMEYDQTYFDWPDNHLNIFPIPSQELPLNREVTQNPGY